MTCSLCTKPALTAVKGVGFCGDHRAQAVKAMAAQGSKKTGRGIIVYPRRTA